MKRRISVFTGTNDVVMFRYRAVWFYPICFGSNTAQNTMTGGYWANLLASLLFRLDCIVHSGLPLFFWVRPKWSIEEMPLQTGKVSRFGLDLSCLNNGCQVVVVTGGNSGTGYATCKAYYDRGAKVYMASRSESRAMEAIQAIKDGHDLGFGNAIVQKASKQRSTTRGELVFLQVDLTDLESVESFCQEIKRYVIWSWLSNILDSTGKSLISMCYLPMQASWQRESLTSWDLMVIDREVIVQSKATVCNLAPT